MGYVQTARCVSWHLACLGGEALGLWRRGAPLLVLLLQCWSESSSMHVVPPWGGSFTHRQAMYT